MTGLNGLEPLGRDWDDLRADAWHAALESCESTEEVASVVMAGIVLELLAAAVMPRRRRRWFRRKP